jgi:hypothetical protein
MVNPLAAILQPFRHAVLDPAAPTATGAAGGWVALLVPGAIVLTSFASDCGSSTARLRVAEEL